MRQHQHGTLVAAYSLCSFALFLFLLLSRLFVFASLVQICTRDVFARLNSKASMVRFLDDPEEYDTAPFISKMDSKIAEILVLNQALAEKEKQLQVTPAYLMKSMRGPQGAHEMDMAVARGLSLQDTHGGAGFADDDAQLQAALQASMQQ